MNSIIRTLFAAPMLVSGLLAASPANAQDTVIYYHTDAIGSVRAITNNSGVVIARYDYMPFGELPPTNPPQAAEVRQFAGKERDSSTELDYFGARYYRAVSGRFTTVDPVLNIEAALIDPQRWHRFAYARNNPYVFIDPDGRDITTPASFQHHAFTQQTGANLAAVTKVAINIMRAMNSPGHMTPDGELRYYEQPQSRAEARRMQFLDLVVSAAPLIFRGLSSSAGSVTRTFDLEATHATTLSNRAFNRLKADIAANGIKDPIKYVVHDGRKFVVDGHHRLRAARELGLRVVPTEEVSLPYAGYRTVADLNEVRK